MHADIVWTRGLIYDFRLSCLRLVSKTVMELTTEQLTHSRHHAMNRTHVKQLLY